MKNKLIILFALILSVTFTGCLDLDETLYDEVPPGQIGGGSVDDIYNSLRGDFNAEVMTCPWFLFVYPVQTSTDEICVPVQNMDWYDGGMYVDMQNHTWKNDNKIFLSCWNYLYTIISTCNNKLYLSETFGYSDKSKAEIRLLRAYAYYRLIDLFGNVPIVTEENIGQKAPKNSPRAEVYQWIETELNDPVMHSLPNKKYGAMNKGVLFTLKARLYLNSKVFLGLDNESTEYKLNLDKAIVACDSVIQSGRYSIEPNVFANFYLDNGPSSKEIIFAIPYNGDGSTLGNRLQMMSLFKEQSKVFGHEMYSHATGGLVLNPGKTADDPNATFNLFKENDSRRLAILHGMQYDKTSGDSITFGYWPRENPSDPRIPRAVTYKPFFTGGFTHEANGNASLSMYRGDGARLIKFELDNNPVDYEQGVDMIVMRYAEVLYTKAECLIRLGRGTEAVPLFEQVLQYRGFDSNQALIDNPDTDASWANALMSKRWLNPQDIKTYYSDFIPANPDLEFMDQEWRREFIFEDRRRTDMIRMDKFITGTWGGKLSVSDSYRTLFPIPTTILESEPNLEQNPGYTR